MKAPDRESALEDIDRFSQEYGARYRCWVPERRFGDGVQTVVVG
jgi:hypothetical protein